MVMFASKDEEKREVLLHNVNIEKTLDTSDSASNGVKEGRDLSKCWRRIPGLGFILIIIKNLMEGVSDSVAKKLENIGKNFISFVKLTRLEVDRVKPWN